MNKRNLGKSLMRIIAVVCVVAMLPLATFAASATVTIATAVSGETPLGATAAEAPTLSAGAVIDVTGTHSTPDAEVTYLVAPEGATTPIEGIGQRTSASDTGAFTIKVALPQDIADGTYYIKVGGQDVDAPQSRYFKIGSGETPVVPEASLTVTITGAGKVTSTGAYEGEITGGSAVDYAVGSQFTLTAAAAGSDKFVHWIDARSGRIVSTEPAYSFTLGTDMTLQAVFRAADAPAYVIFKEKNNKVLLSQDNATDVKVPDDPYAMGYEFESWVNENGLPQKLNAGDVIAANTYTDDMVFTASHKVAEETYTVTLVNAQGAESGEYKYDTRLTVTPAAAPSGEKFSHWEKDGTVISYDEEYTFYVAAYDTTVEAKYVAAAQVVTPEPVIVMAEPFMVQTNKIAFFSERSLPEGYTLIETGILLGSGAQELTLENAMYTSVSISTDRNGQYTVRKTAQAGEVWSGRAYMIYEHDGEIVTVYSNTVTKSYN